MDGTGTPADVGHPGWTVTGDPNATLHFTHPGGWVTLDSPLPAR